MEVERRSLLKSLAAGVAGSAIAPGTAGARPVDTEPTGAAQAAQAPVPEPGLLDEHQRGTLSSLAELILPGSVTAGAVAVIDRVALAGTASDQRRLLNAIARFDQEARAAGGARWLDLTDRARVDVLTLAAASEPGGPPDPVWRRGEPMVFPPDDQPPPTTLRDELEYLKATIGAAYAATEAGMKVLGWTGRTSWREFPGCDHPESAHD